MTGIITAAGFHVGAAVPIDDRMVLADIATIPLAQRYVGMIAYQTGAGTTVAGAGTYQLQGGTADANFTPFGGGGTAGLFGGVSNALPGATTSLDRSGGSSFLLRNKPGAAVANNVVVSSFGFSAQYSASPVLFNDNFAGIQGVTQEAQASGHAGGYAQVYATQPATTTRVNVAAFKWNGMEVPQGIITGDVPNLTSRGVPNLGFGAVTNVVNISGSTLTATAGTFEPADVGRNVNEFSTSDLAPKTKVATWIDTTHVTVTPTPLSSGTGVAILVGSPTPLNSYSLRANDFAIIHKTSLSTAPAGDPWYTQARRTVVSHYFNTQQPAVQAGSLVPGPGGMDQWEGSVVYGPNAREADTSGGPWINSSITYTNDDNVDAHPGGIIAGVCLSPIMLGSANGSMRLNSYTGFYSNMLVVADGGGSAFVGDMASYTTSDFIQCITLITTIVITATSGTFTLTYQGATTAAITVSGLVGTDISAALTALSVISTSDFSVQSFSWNGAGTVATCVLNWNIGGVTTMTGAATAGTVTCTNSAPFLGQGIESKVGRWTGLSVVTPVVNGGILGRAIGIDIGSPRSRTITGCHITNGSNIITGTGFAPSDVGATVHIHSGTTAVTSHAAIMNVQFLSLPSFVATVTLTQPMTLTSTVAVVGLTDKDRGPMGSASVNIGLRTASPFVETPVYYTGTAVKTGMTVKANAPNAYISTSSTITVNNFGPGVEGQLISVTLVGTGTINWTGGNLSFPSGTSYTQNQNTTTHWRCVIMPGAFGLRWLLEGGGSAGSGLSSISSPVQLWPGKGTSATPFTGAPAWGSGVFYTPTSFHFHGASGSLQFLNFRPTLYFDATPGFVNYQLIHNSSVSSNEPSSAGVSLPPSATVWDEPSFVTDSQTNTVGYWHAGLYHRPHILSRSTLGVLGGWATPFDTYAAKADYISNSTGGDRYGLWFTKPTLTASPDSAQASAAIASIGADPNDPSGSTVITMTSAFFTAQMVTDKWPLFDDSGHLPGVVTGTTCATHTSTNLTSSAAVFTSGMVGLAVSGPGIPAGTTITAFGSTTSVTLSNAATATASALQMIIGPYITAFASPTQGTLSVNIGRVTATPGGSGSLALGGDTTNPSACAIQDVGESFLFSDHAPATYNALTAYNPGDYVVNSGSYYVCVAATVGNAPPNATYWDPAATNWLGFDPAGSYVTAVTGGTGGPISNLYTLPIAILDTLDFPPSQFQSVARLNIADLGSGTITGPTVTIQRTYSDPNNLTATGPFSQLAGGTVNTQVAVYVEDLASTSVGGDWGVYDWAGSHFDAIEVGRRQITDGVISTATTLTSASAHWTSADLGQAVIGAGIPAGTFILTVSSSTVVTLSTPCTNASTLTITIGAPQFSVNNAGTLNGTTAVFSVYGAPFATGGIIDLRQAGGSAGNPSVTNAGNTIGFLRFFGYNSATSNFQVAAQITAHASETYSTSGHGAAGIAFWTRDIGAGAPTIATVIGYKGTLWHGGVAVPSPGSGGAGTVTAANFAVTSDGSVWVGGLTIASGAPTASTIKLDASTGIVTATGFTLSSGASLISSDSTTSSTAAGTLLGPVIATSTAPGPSWLARNTTIAPATGVVLGALAIQGTSAAATFNTGIRVRGVSDGTGWDATHRPTRMEFLTAGPLISTALAVVGIFDSVGTFYVGPTTGTSNFFVDQTGALASVSISTGIINATVVTGSSFSGAGASLTSLNASNISSGTLAVARGGTAVTSATLGDLLYGSGSGTRANLAGNTTATKLFLTQTGTGSVSAAPAWGAIAMTDLGTSPTSAKFLRGDGVWAAVSGGATYTGDETTVHVDSGTFVISLKPALAAGDVLIASATNTLSSVAIGTTGKFLRSNGTTPSWQTIGVADGGTGQTSYTIGDILYASGSTALSKLADVATGNVLISGGTSTAPSWGKVGLTTHVTGTLGVTNGGTGWGAWFTGALAVGNASSAMTQLTIGSVDTVLYSNGAAPGWSGVTGDLSLSSGVWTVSKIGSQQVTVGIFPNDQTFTADPWASPYTGVLSTSNTYTLAFAAANANVANTVSPLVYYAPTLIVTTHNTSSAGFHRMISLSPIIKNGSGAGISVSSTQGVRVGITYEGDGATLTLNQANYDVNANVTYTTLNNGTVTATTSHTSFVSQMTINYDSTLPIRYGFQYVQATYGTQTQPPYSRTTPPTTLDYQTNNGANTLNSISGSFTANDNGATVVDLTHGFIPAGTTLTFIDASHCTMSANATGSGTCSVTMTKSASSTGYTSGITKTGLITTEYGIFVPTLGQAGVTSWAASLAGNTIDGAGNTVLNGNTTMNNQVLIQQPTLGSPVLIISSVATNDDPTETIIQGRLSTSNSTSPTTIVSIPTATGQVVYFWADIVARKTSGAGTGTVGFGFGGRVEWAWRNDAGALSFIGSIVSSIANHDTAFPATPITVTNSGTNIVIQATGLASNAYTWHATVHYWAVST